jgi:quercetin dioxygenase-like cupin family protein
VNAGRLRVEVVALRKGASMDQHRTTGHVTIHILRGALRVITPEGPADLGPGGLLVLAPYITHAVTARRDASFLLTLALE